MFGLAWKTVNRTAYGSQRPPSIHMALEIRTRTGFCESSWRLVERSRRNSSSKAGDIRCRTTVVTKRTVSHMYVPGAVAIQWRTAVSRGRVRSRWWPPVRVLPLPSVVGPGRFRGMVRLTHAPRIQGVIDIPDELIATQYAYNGAAGRAFVAALPGLAGRFLEGWGLRRDGAAMYGMCALVLPVVREADGMPAALKLQLVDEETAGEPVALRAWGAAGAGAVRLLEHDAGTGALLLERLDEGRPLSGTAGGGGVPGGSRLVGEVADARRAVTVLGGVLARLTAVPAPEGLRTLGDAVAADAGGGAGGGGAAGGRGGPAAARGLRGGGARRSRASRGTGCSTGTCTTTTSWRGGRTRGSWLAHRPEAAGG